MKLLLNEISNLLTDFEQVKQQLKELQKQVDNRPQQQWYSIKEVSRITGIAVSNLEKRIKRGDLISINEGKRLIRRCEVLRIKAKQDAKFERQKRLNLKFKGK